MMGSNNFLWGVVNIGQQTEGSDSCSNWQKWSQRGLVPQLKQANNYWKQYEADHDLVEDLGCNSFRLTIEWSRLEPEEGRFDQQAINQYKKILIDLQRRNIKTVIGLWHWSVPMWFEERYGAHHPKCAYLFYRFSKQVRDQLGDLINYVVVLNEPSVYLATSYLSKKRPPFYKSYFLAWRVFNNLIKMHRQSYQLWKEKYPDVNVGSTYLYNCEEGRDDSLLQNVSLKIKRYVGVGYMINALNKYSDYLGINYYTYDSFYFGISNKKYKLHGTNNWQSPNVWKSFPKGLYKVLVKLKKYNKPIIILENGKPTNLGVDDKDRQKFIQESAKYIQKAIEEEVDIKGYFHYSLCDSYEWDSGYNFKFGLVEIDRLSGQRIKRKSFGLYKEIINLQ